jgi:ParB family chromosome partitioning protein
MLDMNYEIKDLQGAVYNPRKIADEDIEILCESIRKLGLLKPIIARGNLIIAGHQRTKALRKMGVTHAAVYQLSQDTNTYEETRFNQLHNGTDMDAFDENCTVPPQTGLGYTTIPGQSIKGNFGGKLAIVRKEICNLIARFGPWGGIVVTQSGEVIHCAQYALAAHITRTPCTAYVIPDDRKEEYQKFLNRAYGVFSYEHLEKDTWIQTFAQMYRLRPSSRRNSEVALDGSNQSTLYEQLVIPFIQNNPKMTFLDFGAGQGDYVRRLKKMKVDIDELEFFRRDKKALDPEATHRMIDKVLAKVKSQGGYDVVVCDSVMNSVDSPLAERSVVRMLNALCKPGGYIFFSGRSTSSVDDKLSASTSTGKASGLSFLDEHGFTALYREGSWFYQKFHDKDQVLSLCERCNITAPTYYTFGAATWQLAGHKGPELPDADMEEAVNFEFNLPFSKTQSYGRNVEMLAALREAVIKRNERQQ